MVALTVGRPVQIFALVAVLAVFGGGATLMLHKQQTPKPVVIEPRHVVAARLASRAKPAAPPKPVAVARKQTPPAPVAANGLPTPLAQALRAHRIVVVSLFDPQSPTDAISFAEARAGAHAAKVGFLGVSVLDNAVAGPLTAVLPSGQLLPDPGLLIYRRPDTLVQRIDGFADRDSVRQAAVASLYGPALR